MIKKYLIMLLFISICLVIVGCGNKEIDENDEILDNVSETSNNSNDDNKIELYSDDHKIVFKNGSGYIVYYYSGETITGYETYLDYGDAATAKLALLAISKDDEGVKNAYTKGRYLVVEYEESEYDGTTVNEIKTLYSYLEEINKK